MARNENETPDEQLLSARQPLPDTGPNSILTSQITEISGLRHFSQNSTYVYASTGGITKHRTVIDQIIYLQP